MPERDHTPLDRDRDNLSDDKERNRILEEVLRDQARREVLRDVAYRRPTASLRTRVAAAVLSVVALTLWVFRIPGLTPEIAFPLQPAEEEIGLRLAAYIQAQQVENFRQTTGRLPDLLRESGEPMPGMTYERVNSHTYRLTGMTERDTVEWLSTDSFPALLGDSAQARLGAFVR
jgi:hypothetical protein